MKRELRDAMRSLSAARSDLLEWYRGNIEALTPEQRRQIARVDSALANAVVEDGMLRQCIKILENIPQIDD